MAPKIVVNIDQTGTIETDFIGFEGRRCEDAERRLRTELARLGVMVRGKSFPKSENRILHELQGEKKCRTGMRRKVEI